jgi:hypothetical protein
MAIILPLEKRKPTLTSPKRLVIFSKPKVGKTIMTAQLPKSLIVDFEEGSLAIDAVAFNVIEHLKESKLTLMPAIRELATSIVEANRPYEFGILDTASALEELCIKTAEINYAKSPDGKDWLLKDDKGKLHPKSGKAKYGSIMNLPFGKGYAYVADVFMEVTELLGKVFPKIIILAHSTYNTVNKDDVEMTSLDIMMSKKCKFVTTFKADAIGYVYRKGKKNFINFTPSDDVSAGGRFRYLEKEHILLSEYDEQDNLVTYWEKVFPELGQNQGK